MRTSDCHADLEVFRDSMTRQRFCRCQVNVPHLFNPRHRTQNMRFSNVAAIAVLVIFGSAASFLRTACCEETEVALTMLFLAIFGSAASSLCSAFIDDTEVALPTIGSGASSLRPACNKETEIVPTVIFRKYLDRLPLL